MESKRNHGKRKPYICSIAAEHSTKKKKISNSKYQQRKLDFSINSVKAEKLQIKSTIEKKREDLSKWFQAVEMWRGIVLLLYFIKMVVISLRTFQLNKLNTHTHKNRGVFCYTLTMSELMYRLGSCVCVHCAQRSTHNNTSHYNGKRNISRKKLVGNENDGFLVN